MSQASYIAGSLLLGFIVFVTIRGELPQYKAAIFSQASVPASGSGS